MIRVLQVYPQMNNAGTERVIFNLYENIDTSKVQFDFLVQRPGEMDAQIGRLGGCIHYLYKEKIRDYYAALIVFFKEHTEYKIVHTHTHARMDIVLKAAKKCGIPCRIAHSHNARNDLPKIAAFLKGLTSIPLEHNANYFFACSRNAAKWLFPHRINECKILYNGIKLDDYLFNLEYRKKIRKRLGIAEDMFLMLHVGRFARQKNHEYLVKVLQSYQMVSQSNWKMLLVGEGPLQDTIKAQINAAGLSEHIVFMGSRKDVNEVYSAADMFVFPSLHEGLGIVVVEAQASGLLCVVSDAVPQEADMGIGLLKTLRPQENPNKWAQCILESQQGIFDREKNRKAILNSKYNIQTIAARMQDFYLEKSNG